MRRTGILVFVVMILLALVVTGCGAPAVSPEDYDKLTNDLAAAQGDLAAAQGSLSEAETKIAELEAELTVEKVMFLFVQNAHSGSFIPVEGETNRYTLSLNDIAPQTIYFSDRPERIVGQAPMQPFLDGMCFTEENPPNAALEILGADEAEDVVVVELFDPLYDADNRTLKYTASILEEADHSYTAFNERHDKAIPETFGHVALFIDSCSDDQFRCYKDDGSFCGWVTCCQCFNALEFGCGFQPDCCSEGRCDGNCQKKYGSDCRFQ